MSTQPFDPATDGIDVRLDDKVIVLTGASAGLGVQFARALSRAGARLVLTARREERLAAVSAELPGPCLIVPADLSAAQERQAVVDAALEHYGRIDGLVNNAGDADVGPALRQTVEQFERIVAINLVAPYALMTQAAAAMRDQGIGGSIVNISSVIGQIPVSWQPNASYSASKSGLIGLTRELASQWGRYAIRVNSIAPGPFTSEMAGDSYETGWTAERMKQAVPLGRVGRPGEMDGLLLLLLHPASSFISGQTIAVDGGLSASL
ncbi:MAG: short-chain dehydrogenase/reductase [Solirubrobacterales bacterium]|jgi:NAD(P)-dependent dehydrogenase (short-subunit alcohol dehydrogenase family)|nr:short-chain dehydrogenase/reductase [Solirubrobacterales bacterium]